MDEARLKELEKINQDLSLFINEAKKSGTNDALKEVGLKIAKDEILKRIGNDDLVQVVNFADNIIRNKQAQIEINTKF